MPDGRFPSIPEFQGDDSHRRCAFPSGRSSGAELSLGGASDFNGKLLLYFQRKIV
jgi:hypothetical protein